jgi:hypothetical protein
VLDGVPVRISESSTWFDRLRLLAGCQSMDFLPLTASSAPVM